ncbi:MAG: cyclase family protein [Candidatus Brocadiales bacterium]
MDTHPDGDPVVKSLCLICLGILLVILVLFLWPHSFADNERGLLESVIEGRARVIDLTYPLNDKNPYWPGPRYRPFKHETIATLESDGVYSGSYSTPEHLGTHLDAPNHFDSDQPSVDQLSLNELVGPAVVIDIRKQAASDPDYRLSVGDIRKWEAQNGRIPKGAIVLMHSGWGERWTDSDRYKNADPSGTLHWPGFSGEAALLLAEERDVKAIGVDTLSVDNGPSGDYPVHHVFNSRGRWMLENLDNLEKLPPKGSTLIVAPIKIEGGSGGQARVWAVIHP